MKSIAKKVFLFFSSFGLASVLLLLLLLLTFLGTLEQTESGLYAVQKKYFESVFLVHDLFGTIPIVLPGVYLLLILLTVNLICGGLVRLRFRWSVAGVVIAHVGILLMLAAGLVKFKFSEDGALRLFEGKSGAHFSSYHEWELAFAESSRPPSPDQPLTERVIHASEFLHVGNGEERRFTSNDLPFDLVISGAQRNAKVLPKGPMFKVDVPVIDGYFIAAEPVSAESESNVPAAYVTVIDKSTGTSERGIIWGLADWPLTIRVGDDVYTFHLRHERWSLPFQVELTDFVREVHPGTMRPASFYSDIVKIQDGVRQDIRISMNQPLRDGGFTLFQSSFGPPGARLGQESYSVFAVVRNPSDHWPLYSCIIICLGMLLHFSIKLWGYQKLEASRRS